MEIKGPVRIKKLLIALCNFIRKSNIKTSKFIKNVVLYSMYSMNPEEKCRCGNAD